MIGQINHVIFSAASALHFQIAITGVEGVAEQCAPARAWPFMRIFHASQAATSATLRASAGALLGGLDSRAEVPTEEAAYSGLLDHLLALPA